MKFTALPVIRLALSERKKERVGHLNEIYASYNKNPTKKKFIYFVLLNMSRATSNTFSVNLEIM